MLKLLIQDRSVLPVNNQILVNFVDATSQDALSIAAPSGGFPVGGGFRINLIKDANDVSTIYAQSDNFDITAGSSSGSASGSTVTAGASSTTVTGSTVVVSGTTATLTTGSVSVTGSATYVISLSHRPILLASNMMLMDLSFRSQRQWQLNRHQPEPLVHEHERSSPSQRSFRPLGSHASPRCHPRLSPDSELHPPLFSSVSIW